MARRYRKNPAFLPILAALGLAGIGIYVATRKKGAEAAPGGGLAPGGAYPGLPPSPQTPSTVPMTPDQCPPTPGVTWSIVNGICVATNASNTPTTPIAPEPTPYDLPLCADVAWAPPCLSETTANSKAECAQFYGQAGDDWDITPDGQCIFTMNSDWQTLPKQPSLTGYGRWR